jgi:hypothetical protein
VFNYWFKNVDIRVTRYFDVTGVGKVGIMLEGFNLFNWTNYTAYRSIQNQVIGGVQVFGLPTSASPTRQLQLGARVTF